MGQDRYVTINKGKQEEALCFTSYNVSNWKNVNSYTNTKISNTKNPPCVVVVFRYVIVCKFGLNEYT